MQEARRRSPARSASPCTHQMRGTALHNRATASSPLPVLRLHPQPKLCAEATSRIQPEPGFVIQIRDPSLAAAQSRLDEGEGSLGCHLPAPGGHRLSPAARTAPAVLRGQPAAAPPPRSASPESGARSGDGDKTAPDTAGRGEGSSPTHGGWQRYPRCPPPASQDGPRPPLTPPSQGWMPAPRPPQGPAGREPALPTRKVPFGAGP